MKPSLVAALVSGLLVGAAPALGYAGSASFSIAIGYNGRPPELHESALDLQFADDDAMAMHELVRTVARRSIVLTLPDRATQARYQSSRDARPPLVGELQRALRELRSDIEQANLAGEETVVWFFYSGHGWLDKDGKANLALADGALSQAMLYDEILPALPGRTVHLIIDACHAEAMIRPRDLEAETVEVSAAQVAVMSLRGRLDHLPNVGVLMASASTTQAHEWDDYQTGVFTHELLSGLRGGADVNGDGRIEYSEIAAFLRAANRGVTDPRARLTTLVLPPKLYPRAVIVDTRTTNPVARLRGRANHLGHFQVDDQRGNRLLDLRFEPGFSIDVLVPAGERILLSNDVGEIAIETSANSIIDVETIALSTPRARARGPIGDLLRRGLFATEFGPSYYRGYVDSSDGSMLPVDLVPVAALVAAPVGPPPEAIALQRRNTAAWTALALSGVSFAVATACGIAALGAYDDYQRTSFQRQSGEARDRYAAWGTATLSAAVVGTAAAGVATWLWTRRSTTKH